MLLYLLGVLVAGDSPQGKAEVDTANPFDAVPNLPDDYKVKEAEESVKRIGVDVKQKLKDIEKRLKVPTMDDVRNAEASSFMEVANRFNHHPLSPMAAQKWESAQAAHERSAPDLP